MEKIRKIERKEDFPKIFKFPGLRLEDSPWPKIFKLGDLKSGENCDSVGHSLSKEDVMEKNWELLRTIMQVVEKSGKHASFHMDFPAEYTESQINEGFACLKKIGFILAEKYETKELYWSVKEITKLGDTFLDLSRNNSDWEEAMKYFKNKGRIPSFEVLVKFLKDLQIDWE